MRKSGLVTSAKVAISSISDNAVVAISGFNMATTPEYLIVKLLERFEREGHPKGLFLIGDALPAIPGRAMDLVAKRVYDGDAAGMVRGFSFPFFGFSPYLQKLVTENRVEAYSWPMGVAAYWFREVASGRPGVISKIGIDTAIDPRKGGGKLNGLAAMRSTCDVKQIALDGKEYLLYEAPKPDFALVRGSAADQRGNLSMEDEAIRGTVLSIAQATKAHPSPGVVIAQVRRLDRKEMGPRAVEVPGPFMDYIVVAPEKYHWQAGTTSYEPSFSYKEGAKPLPRSKVPVEPLQAVAVRRVTLELVSEARKKGSPLVVNLGIGMPALVSRVAIDEKVSDYIITVLESGQWGGLARAGEDFGIAEGPFALSTMPDMFSNFEGGTIDAASLGFLQVGSNGDVNPSMLPGRIYGPGGFPVIAGGSPRIYFTGAFTAGKSDIRVKSGKLEIVSDGETKKFVNQVYRNFFSGEQALKFGKKVLYVTERAVFSLEEGGLVLTEVAPGVDLERDVLGKMEFRPRVDKNLAEMEGALFRPGPMRLAERLRA